MKLELGLDQQFGKELWKQKKATLICHASSSCTSRQICEIYDRVESTECESNPNHPLKNTL